MKFGLIAANTGPFGRPENLVPLVQTAEAVGIESLWTAEHVVVPRGYAPSYPMSRDGRMPGPDDDPIPDPYVWLSFAAAVTKTIKLATGVLILPQRHPFYVAKESATLDVLSGGRHLLGVGVGWMEEEYRSLGVPFEERGAITDESIEALRSLWAEGPSSHAGKRYRWSEVESNPKPVNGRVPIVIGGHTKASARRAARLGDGFFPARADKLPACRAELVAECDRIGRDPGEIEITTAWLPTYDEVRKLEDQGVSRFIVAPPAFTTEEAIRGLEKLGNQLFSKF